MILPPATLGMLGGGQLGRYFVMAAHRLGYKVVVLDPDPASIAGAASDHHIVAPYDDQTALHQMALRCDAITCEFENVPAATLALLEQQKPVRPGASAELTSRSPPIWRYCRKSLSPHRPANSYPPFSRQPAKGTTARDSGR